MARPNGSTRSSENLESLAVQLAPTWPAAALEDMRTANRDLDAALDAGDPVAASSADDAFHDVILREAGNAELTTAGPRHEGADPTHRGHLLRGATTGERSCREHPAVIEALATGDISAATDALRLNWSGTLERVRGRDGIDAARWAAASAPSSSEGAWRPAAAPRRSPG